MSAGGLTHTSATCTCGWGPCARLSQDIILISQQELWAITHTFIPTSTRHAIRYKYGRQQDAVCSARRGRFCSHPKWEHVCPQSHRKTEITLCAVSVSTRRHSNQMFASTCSWNASIQPRSYVSSAVSFTSVCYSEIRVALTLITFIIFVCTVEQW